MKAYNSETVRARAILTPDLNTYDCIPNTTMTIRLLYNNYTTLLLYTNLLYDNWYTPTNVLI
jgi:hypothetical protein